MTEIDQKISTIPVVLLNDQGRLAVLSPHDYIQAATSNNTRKAYQSDIRHFTQWGGLLPTAADLVMHYLQQQAGRLNPRTLVRRLTALRNWHLTQGFPDPTAHPAIQKTLRGIKNVHGKPKNKAPALTLAFLTEMVSFLKKSDRLMDSRNNALLQIGFFGAFRRSEVVALTWEAVHFVPEGIEILILRSKTDQTGEGQSCAIPYGDGILCPVRALIAWRDRSCQSGPIFRQIQGAQISPDPIKAHQMNVLIKSIAKACQLPDHDLYSSHSLRRGFATEASKQGVPFGSIMRQGRWRHEGTVLGYMDEGKRFEQNAAGLMLNHETSTDPE
jgi:integrase